MLHGHTLIKIKGALKRSSSVATVAAFKLGRTFHHFGHNGPLKKIIAPATVTSSATSSGDPTAVLLPVPAMDVEVPERTIRCDRIRSRCHR